MLTLSDPVGAEPTEDDDTFYLAASHSRDCFQRDLAGLKEWDAQWGITMTTAGVCVRACLGLVKSRHSRVCIATIVRNREYYLLLCDLLLYKITLLRGGLM